MSEETLNTPESVPGASDVSAPEGGGTEAGLTLEELSATLGKELKDKDSALKSIKDTFNYVGGQAKFREQMQTLTQKLGTDETGVLSALEALAGTKPASATPQAPAGDYVPKSQYERDQFFATNPSYKGLQDVLIPLKEANPNMSWSDFVKQDHIANLVEKDKAYAELQSKRSVVESNPKIGAATDKMTEARNALSQGNQEGAKRNAVSAVIDLL